VKKLIILLLMILVMLISSFLWIYQTNSEKGDLSITGDVEYISKNIGSRPAGSLKEKDVAVYLQERFEDYGVSTEIQEFQYCKKGHDEVKNSWNVIGTIPGISKKEIIIGADLDTYQENGAINGANDDATGLALLIALSEHYREEKPYYTLKLVGFGAGEEPYTTPLLKKPASSYLSNEQYNNIMDIPYLVGARYYVLQNPTVPVDTVAVITLETVGIGDPYFVSEDSFIENNPEFIDSLINKTKQNGLKIDKIGYISYKKDAKELPISHVYLPFAYTGIPSTFLTCMKNTNTQSTVHNNTEIPGYLTTNDTYENLLKYNNGKEKLEKHLKNILKIITTNLT
jgi:hypothetical protein